MSVGKLSFTARHRPGCPLTNQPGSTFQPSSQQHIIRVAEAEVGTKTKRRHSQFARPAVGQSAKKSLFCWCKFFDISSHQKWLYSPEGKKRSKKTRRVKISTQSKQGGKIASFFHVLCTWKFRSGLGLGSYRTRPQRCNGTKRRRGPRWRWRPAAACLLWSGRLRRPNHKSSNWTRPTGTGCWRRSGWSSCEFWIFLFVFLVDPE